jgi:hypothetical protein
MYFNIGKQRIGKQTKRNQRNPYEIYDNHMIKHMKLKQKILYFIKSLIALLTRTCP